MMATKRGSKTTATRKQPAAKEGRATRSTGRRPPAAARTKGTQRDARGSLGDEKPDSLAAKAYESILGRIVKLELEPGRAFTEGELAGELGLSKTPVREALLMLRVRGFVFPRPRAGYRVSTITVKDIGDLFGLLKIIEPECAARVAAKGVGVKRILVLEDLPVEVDAADPQSIDEFIDGEISFRQFLAWESGSERLHFLSDVLAYDLARLLRLTVNLEQPPNVIGNYKKLIAALARGDAAKAREVARHRVDLLEGFVLDTLLKTKAVQGVNVGAPITGRRG